MAKYLLRGPAFVDGDYKAVDPAFPEVFTFRDDLAPSRKWEPLDEAAVKALAKLGVKKAIVKAPESPKVDAHADQHALSEIGGKVRRAADREP